MGATNSWKCQDNFVTQTVFYIFYSNMDTRTLVKNFVRYTHLNLLHEHNVIYAKETYLLCLFERSFDDDNDDDLLRRNLSKRGASSGSFRRHLQVASERGRSSLSGASRISCGRGRFLKSSFGGGPLVHLSTIQRTKRRYKRKSL